MCAGGRSPRSILYIPSADNAPGWGFNVLHVAARSLNPLGALFASGVSAVRRSWSSKKETCRPPARTRPRTQPKSRLANCRRAAKKVLGSHRSTRGLGKGLKVCGKRTSL
ncbi:alkaline phosphatase [Anopheles sinensis]|uniref:Alkaline phosphatase n=1 Tax=Anopheles sinensis TaxID=74873 RepID=A0A084VIB0_ANOSI|nr:alkaline phosphatase [Anopheles sinensis]